MANPLTIVVLVAAAELNDGATTALTRAAHQALGPDSTVLVRELRPSLRDEDAAALGRSLHADAVAEVSWVDRRRARVHVRIEPTGRWVDRVISFSANDASAERGRALGFAVVSMMPNQEGAPQSPPAVVPAPTSSSGAGPSPGASSSATPAPTPPSTTTATPTPTSTSTPTSTPSAAAPATPGGTPSAPTPPPPTDTSAAPPTPPEERAPVRPTPKEDDRSEPPRHWSGAVEATGIGAVGVGGQASGVGGALSGQWYFAPHVALRLVGGARVGQVAAAQSTSLVLLGGGGLVWRAVDPRPFGLDIRLDALALRHSLSRTAADDPSTQARWLPGGDLALEASWFFGPATGFVVGLGAEAALGQTSVFVRDAVVATIPPVRMVAEAGLRARF